MQSLNDYADKGDKTITLNHILKGEVRLQKLSVWVLVDSRFTLACYIHTSKESVNVKGKRLETIQTAQMKLFRKESKYMIWNFNV